jgi:hypothetical protein
VRSTQLARAFTRIAVLCLLACASGCSERVENQPKAPADDRVAAVKADEKASAAAVADAERAARINAMNTGKLWLTNSGRSQMSDTPWALVYRYSLNTLSFDFPYQGAQRATLHIKLNKGRVETIYLMVEHGQFDCQDGCSMQVRFDDRPAYSPSFKDTEDRVPSLRLQAWPVDHTKEFIADLFKAHRLRMQPRFYHQDSPVIEFELDGLRDAIAEATAPPKVLSSVSTR